MGRVWRRRMQIEGGKIWGRRVGPGGDKLEAWIWLRCSGCGSTFSVMVSENGLGVMESGNQCCRDSVESGDWLIDLLKRLAEFGEKVMEGEGSEGEEWGIEGGATA